MKFTDLKHSTSFNKDERIVRIGWHKGIAIIITSGITNQSSDHMVIHRRVQYWYGYDGKTWSDWVVVIGDVGKESEEDLQNAADILVEAAIENIDSQNHGK